MKIPIFRALCVGLIVLAATANAQEILIEDADGVWQSSSNQPTDKLAETEPKITVNLANGLYHNTLEAAEAFQPTISPRVLVNHAKGLRHIPFAASVPTGLETAASQVAPRVIINQAKGLFTRPLIPMIPAIADLVPRASGDSGVDLTWTNQRATEFPTTLVVYSHQPISWRPEKGASYAVGQVVGGSTTVGFVGNADHSQTPLSIGNLASGTAYSFMAFAFDADGRYSSGSRASVITGGQGVVGHFELDLKRGLNFISLPVDLGTPYSAKQLADEADATLVLKYDADGQRFVAYVPELSELDVFTIEGGQGYIVNILDSKTVVFEGRVWDNTAAAPVVATSVASVWAFAVAGQIATDTPTDGLRVTVSNPRTNWQADEALQPTGGRFAVAFADMSRRSVVEVGDTLEIRVTDNAGHVLHSGKVPVTDTSLREARLILPPLQVRTSPADSALLPNFPNPFNPETWIPYTLAEANDVTIRIYDTQGREVRVIELGFKPAGWYDTKATAAYWDGRNATGERISSGIYFLVMETGSSRQIRRSVVLK